MNFLGQVGLADPEMNNPYAVGELPQLPDGSAQIQAALQRNQQLGQQQAQQKKKGGLGDTLRNVLGTIGDALLINSGHAPVYAQHKAQQQAQERRARLGQMLGNYLGNSDAALAELFAEDPDTALAVYKMKNQQPEVPGIIREAQAYNALPDDQKRIAQEYMRLRFPGMSAPITMGANDTIEMPAEQQGEMTATNPQTGEKVRYNPQSGQWEPMQGGPTASPSGDFL